MPSVFGVWGGSLDHLVHLLVPFVLALRVQLAPGTRPIFVAKPIMSLTWADFRY
jgi:hypothetical protein